MGWISRGGWTGSLVSGSYGTQTGTTSASIGSAICQSLKECQMFRSQSGANVVGIYLRRSEELKIVLEGLCLIGAFLFVDSWPAMFVTDHVPLNGRSGTVAYSTQGPGLQIH